MKLAKLFTLFLISSTGVLAHVALATPIGPINPPVILAPPANMPDYKVELPWQKTPSPRLKKFIDKLLEDCDQKKPGDDATSKDESPTTKIKLVAFDSNGQEMSMEANCLDLFEKRIQGEYLKNLDVPNK